MFDQPNNQLNPNNNQDTQNNSDLRGLHDMNKNEDFPFKRVQNDKQPQDIFAVSEKDKKRGVVVERPLGQEGRDAPRRVSEQIDKADKGVSLKTLEARPQSARPVRLDFSAKSESASGWESRPKGDKADLPPGISALSEAPKKKIDFGKFLVPLVIVLVVIILVLIGWWVYGKYFAQQTSFDEFEQESGLTDVLRDLSDDLKDMDNRQIIPDNTDGESNQQEEDFTPPTDSDNDGLSDAEELDLGTNPGRVDTDFDGLSDYDEVKKYFTFPIQADSDNDGYLDGIEVQNGYDPLGPGELVN